MSKVDQITGKRAMTGNTRSFSMNHSRRTWGLNLQNVKVKMPNGSTRKMKVSVRTLKTLKKDGKIAKKGIANSNEFKPSQKASVKIA